ncbi:PAAR domain-containing protein [Rhodoferax aquaticus]|uniref:PAAR domain-containing protein n=1 Tax=Rhodoferax aquaticus TaxID=2527691 RepID=A0A515EPU0_9BURK|nr:PAAR domain-containing protein [Rhodoferax aquaticus]QDL54691.1 PAAR domain-containing protein [Rhodoferax aquaticus]
MARTIIVVGDPTSHGGTVVSGSPTRFIMGKAIARMGDNVDCPKTYPGGAPHGVNPIVEGESSCLIDGIPVALEGHATACGCTLIGTVPVRHG